MSQSYISCYVHCIFSTKDRIRILSPEIEKKFWPFMCGIARDHTMKIKAIGGTENHVHILISLPSSISLSKAMQSLKGISSKWINDTFSLSQLFGWQKGYGAFSVGIRQINNTVRYIKNQKEHHLNQTFEEEFQSFS